MPLQITQTIAVVNKTGKVVSSSKHLVNVFKEARSAYRERKAELQSLRRADLEEQRAAQAEEKRARAALQNFSFDDDRSHHSHRSQRSHRSRRTSKSKHKARPRDGERSKSTPHNAPPFERGFTDTFYADNGDEFHPSRRRYEQDLEGDYQRHELVRRHTDAELAMANRPYSRRTQRSASDSHIDMDLAYGELPPPLPARRLDDEQELRGKMSKLQVMLDEANCLQHSVTAIIENLQKNPDALAAVALTLAEISNLASKMAPGALAGFKGAFPVIIGLLASPQFLIAAGVGIGVTVVMLGGYKIVKQIQAKREEAAVEKQMEAPIELQELESNVDIDKIEHWRRGIAEAEADSVGTTVDGEFITPVASRRLIEEGRLEETDLKSSRSRKKKVPKSVDGSQMSSKRKEKRKEPSGLKMLFKKAEGKMKVIAA